MEYYAYYSAPAELRDDFTDEFILYMEAYYPGYGRIFNNTEEHRIRIIRAGAKKNIQLSSSEESVIKGKALYDQAEKMIHTELMRRLADKLPAGVTVVFNDIRSLGSTLGQIWYIY